MPARVRYGLIAGMIAIVSTLAFNLWILLLRPADLCHMGPFASFLFPFGALIMFIVLAVAAGFATGREAGSLPDATLTGVLVGIVASLALVALIPFIPAVSHRLLELNQLCPGPSSVSGGSFSFTFGPTPPPGVLVPTPPPPPFVIPTPAPASVIFAPPQLGMGGAVSTAMGLVFTMGVGVGLAAGAAALGGLVGTATRHR